MNGKKKLLLAAFLAVTLLSPALRIAQAADPAKPELAMTLDARKEVIAKDADGKERAEWREVKDVHPGDILKYTITYKNVGKAEARTGHLVDAVPKETGYIPGSAEGVDTAIAFSLDGKDFREPPLLKYKVRRPDGTETEIPASPEMYTHIRWTLLKPVPPGGGGSVSFKAKVK